MKNQNITINKEYYFWDIYNKIMQTYLGDKYSEELVSQERIIPDFRFVILNDGWSGYQCIAKVILYKDRVVVVERILLNFFKKCILENILTGQCFDSVKRVYIDLNKLDNINLSDYISSEFSYSRYVYDNLNIGDVSEISSSGLVKLINLGMRI